MSSPGSGKTTLLEKTIKELIKHHPISVIEGDQQTLNDAKRIESAGAQVVLLPPYSPDLNPIEMIFSKLKQLVRSQRPRCLSKIVDATGTALSFISTEDIHACFEHCGYLTA